jgi:hypothetical protein
MISMTSTIHFNESFICFTVDSWNYFQSSFILIYYRLVSLFIRIFFQLKSLQKNSLIYMQTKISKK